MQILFKAGTLITDQETKQADILVDGEKILAVAPGLSAPDAQVVNLDGKIIMPGGVDAHTHFDLPMFGTVSSDDHFTGHKAAAFGGTTTVLDFVPQEAGSLKASVAAWHAKADHKAAIDFGFHMNLSRWDKQVSADLAGLPALGITSIKVFMAYNNRLRLGDADIFQAMRIAKQHGLLTMLHAENGDIIDLLTTEALAAGHHQAWWHAYTRPAWGAVEASLRGAALAAQTESPLYLVHMNVAGEADMLAYARLNGVPMMGETCPQYLFFTEDHLRRPDGSKWVCSPPMRTVADNTHLWQALAEGTIQVIGTDHCPFFYDGSKSILYDGEPVAIPGKELGLNDFTKIPNGLPCVGDRLPVLWTYGVRAGRITPNQFVALMCTNPAKIFGLYPRKGALLPGADADLVIWEPEQRVKYGVKLAQHRTDYNLFENWELVGFPRQVYLRGNLIVNDGQWHGHAGMGQYVHRNQGVVM